MKEDEPFRIFSCPYLASVVAFCINAFRYHYQVKVTLKINDEQVHGGNVGGVVPQKRAPSMTWRATSLDHVLGDARLGDLKSELEQLAVDARRSPKRIVDAHLPDQCAEVCLDLRSPSPRV
jgi:hypothetical protein